MQSFVERKFNWSATASNHADVVPPGHVVDNVEDVYMLKLPVGEAIRPGATSFADAFDRNNEVQVFYEALLQLLLKTTAEMRATFDKDVRAGHAKLAACTGDPIHLYLETVVGERPDEAMLLAGHLINQDPAALASRPFMTGIGDEYPVVEYRLWIFVRARSETFDFDRILGNTIARLKQNYQAKFGHSDVARDEISRGSVGGGGKGKRKRAQSADDGGDGDGGDGISFGDAGGGGGGAVDPCSFTGNASGMMKYGESLNSTNKWRLIRSETIWCTVIDMVLGYRVLTRPELMKNLVSRSLLPDNNPAHARFMLNPQAYFRLPNGYAARAQRNIYNYVVNKDINGRRWTFPVANCVLRVPPNDEEIQRFCLKLLPEHQIRGMGSDLDQAVGRTTGSLRDHSIVSQTYFDAFAAAAAADDAVGMAYDALAEGAGDTDDLAFDLDDGQLDGGAAVDAFGNPIGDDDDTLAGRAARGAGLPGDADAAAADEARRGGVLPEQIRAMLNHVLPRRDELEPFDSLTLLREDFEDSHSLMHQHLLAETDNPDRSSFHRLRFRGARLRSEFNKLAASGTLSRDELLLRRRAMQYDLLRGYGDMCMTSTSQISRVGRLLNGWYEARVREDRPWLGHDLPKIDGSLSTLANMVARRLLRFEAGMYMANMHDMALALSFGSLDAYRHALKLHWNAVLSGDRATSKSFTIDLLSWLRVAGTVITEGNKTDKADNTDVDANDEIRIKHELNPSQFKNRARGGDDKAEADWKEFLTCMTRRTKVFVWDAAGRRLNRTAYSQQIGVTICNTNDEASTFTSAIHSRFSWHVAARSPQSHSR